MRYGYLIVLLVLGTLTGCTTTSSPMTMTCSAVRSSQLTSPGKRIDLRHFSVQLPEDPERWCIGDSGAGRLGLNTHPLMGQYIEKPDLRVALNTVALTAMELDHGSAQFENPLGLKKFVEEWIERGFGAEFTGADIKVMHGRVKGFTTKRFDVSPDPRSTAICVRYEYKMEERGNPLSPDTTLILNDYGLICQHPKTSSDIVVMTLSERYPEGGRLDPGLFLQLKRSVAQAFFDSLQF